MRSARTTTLHAAPMEPLAFGAPMGQEKEKTHNVEEINGQISIEYMSIQIVDRMPA